MGKDSNQSLPPSLPTWSIPVGRRLPNWRRFPGLIAHTLLGVALAVSSYVPSAVSQTQRATPSASPASKQTSPSPRIQPNASQHTNSKSGDRAILQAGSKGNEVSELQALLKLLGYYKGAVSGMFDEATAIGVEAFQKSAGLRADGIVGKDTWNRLLPPSPPVTTAKTPPSTASSSSPIPPVSDLQTPPARPTPEPPNSAPTSQTEAIAKTSGNSSTASSEMVTLPILRLGMQGPAVAGLQERLRSLGYLKGAADGVFGTETQAAVVAAQRGLKLEPDGIVGTSTWIGILK